MFGDAIPEWHRRAEEERAYREAHAAWVRHGQELDDAREALVVARDEGAPREVQEALETEWRRLRDDNERYFRGFELSNKVDKAAFPIWHRSVALYGRWQKSGGWHHRPEVPAHLRPIELDILLEDPWNKSVAMKEEDAIRDIAWARRAHLMAAVGPELVRIAQVGRRNPAATPVETARLERIILGIGVPPLEDLDATAADDGGAAAGAGVAGGKRSGVSSPPGRSKRGGGGPPSASSYSPS